MIDDHKQSTTKGQGLKIIKEISVQEFQSHDSSQINKKGVYRSPTIEEKHSAHAPASALH